MDNKLDPRIVTIGIEVDGKLRVYDDIHVTASGTKYANPLQNECTIQVFNLAREVRDYILTETSPYNKNRTRKRVAISAGRKSTGTFQIFAGDITQATVTQPPDIALTLKARTGQFSKGVIMERSHPTVPLSSISNGVAKDLGLTLVFEAKEKNISNYSFTGAALKQVEKLAEAGQVNAYIDDETLVVKDLNAPLKNVTHTLSESSGMVGIPEVTEQGIKTTMLLVPGVQLGGQFTLESNMYKALSGDYVIYKLGFNVSNWDTPFYWIPECKRKGVPFVKRK